jgi:hypothetical protein
MSNFPISRYADIVGDGSGVKNAIGDYSATGLGQTILKLKPPTGGLLKVSRMIVFIRDTGTFDADEYGNGITLTNGIEIKLLRDVGGANTVLWDITDGLPILSNTHWKRLCHDEIHSTYGVGDESITYRYTFSKDSNGSPIILEDANKEELQIIFNDDFSGLVEHYFRFGLYD